MTSRAPGDALAARLGPGRGVAVVLLAPAAVLRAAGADLVPLFGKFLCFGIAALAMDLVWGYAGILSLGHGLFFALGGYSMGMYLMRSIAGEGVYRSDAPRLHGVPRLEGAALVLARLPALPVRGGDVACWRRARWRWCSGGSPSGRASAASTSRSSPRRSPTRRRCCSSRTPPGFGGNNGLTDFKRILGCAASRSGDARHAVRGVGDRAARRRYVLCRYVVTSRLGRVLTAVRDAELKTRFCGYESTHYKLFVWTLSAMLCGLAGALYVPQVGIINPSEMQPANSIEMAIWVAVGGRGSLVGAVIGACIVAGGKSWLTNAIPSAWLYALGALFVVVTLFLPKGIVGLRSQAAARPRRLVQAKGEAGRHERTRSERRERSRRPTTTTPSPSRVAGARGGAAAAGAVGRGSVGQLRRLQGAERRDAGAGAGRAALPDRPQRRRQDDADGRHHRQDAADDRQRVPRSARDRPDQAVRVPHRRAGHRPEVPAPDGVPGPHRVRELRAGAARPQGRLERAVHPAQRRGAGADRRGPGDHRPRESSEARRPACCRTARSSGWRSGCCWRRTRRCCWSTSRSRA